MSLKFRVFSVCFIISMIVSAQVPKEIFSLSKPLNFNGKEYHLAFSQRVTPEYLVQEYLPEGENLNHYNSMITVSIHFSDLNAEQAVANKIAELNERKQSDKVCNYAIFKRGKEFILDFLVSDIPTGNFTTIEFDVHRYANMKIDGKKAVVLLFYSERAYGDAITQFLQNLSVHRNEIINEIGEYKLPKINLTKK